MLLDLDYFKDVNDTLGHSMGDQLLRAVGNRLSGLLRKGDTIARIGGDEFLLLLPELLQIEYTTTLAQKILHAFREPFVFNDHQLHITTSIGIAIFPDDGDNSDTLMKNADIAMYRAKNKGRDGFQRYTPA
jgi:diguanylate cyclase (GGDEF)-like protein